MGNVVECGGRERDAWVFFINVELTNEECVSFLKKVYSLLL